MQLWIEAIASILIEAVMNAEIACERREDGVIATKAALILSQGLNEPTPFQRVMRQLSLCHDLPK